MVEKREIISGESKVASSFSNFFQNAIVSLGILITKTMELVKTFLLATSRMYQMCIVLF